MTEPDYPYRKRRPENPQGRDEVIPPSPDIAKTKPERVPLKKKRRPA
ncbi:MAG TPA: hypothetical protein VK209_01470 [Candidatus Sulfotelmatobacter sp.]|nr:hypothetical protein [Candidatus Sulfotelmatobacter sp.]